MNDFVELGQAPHNERCAEAGSRNYRINALRECRAYIHAIRNYLGFEPEGSQLSYRRFPHEAGACYEVVCYFDRTRPEAVAYARHCECHAPATWEEGGVKPPPRKLAADRQLGMF